MTKILRFSYWDSCVFLSYLENHPDRATIIESMLDEVKDNQREQRIITSAVSIAEVSYLEGEDDDEALIDELWNNTTIIGIVEFHEGIARLARSIMRQVRELRSNNPYKVSGVDAIHLATAQLYSAYVFYTYDHKLLRLNGLRVVPYSIVEPYAAKPRLPFM